MGRITPLEGTTQYLLERERRKNQWYKIAKGGPKNLIDTIAKDDLGTFHGLGSVEASLREAGNGLVRLEVKRKGKAFVYKATDQRCTAQEALFHYFGIPLDVLIEPREWYVRHRKPVIVENSSDRSRVLVRFCTSSMSGEPIVGTCLYVYHEDEPQEDDDESSSEPYWDAYTIRPNASESIETAETWLLKRKWNPW